MTFLDRIALPDLKAELSLNRAFLMGVSILLVIVFHAFNWVYNPIGPFNIGYIGVDVFIFLSGFGCSFSYEKNPLRTFYSNRFKRVFPIYIVAVSIAFLLCGKSWSWTDYLLNLSTLGFYIKGIPYFDWYIPFLIGLYVLFPVFHFLGKFKWSAEIILFVVVFLILYFIHPQDQYSWALSRLPIFLYGIILRNTKSYKFLLLLVPLLYFPCYFLASPQLAASMIAIPLVVICMMVRNRLHGKIRLMIEWCGKHSLELYLANVLVWYVFNFRFSGSGVLKPVLYIFIQAFFSTLFVWLNALIHKKTFRQLSS